MNDQLDNFTRLAKEHGLNDKTITILQVQDITSVHTLMVLKQSHLESLNLTVGQLSHLEHWIEQLQDVTSEHDMTSHPINARHWQTSDARDPRQPGYMLGTYQSVDNGGDDSVFDHSRSTNLSTSTDTYNISAFGSAEIHFDSPTKSPKKYTAEDAEAETDILVERVRESLKNRYRKRPHQVGTKKHLSLKIVEKCGAKREERSYHELLSETHGGSKILIEGISGIGKTKLCENIAERWADELAITKFTHVFFIEATSIDSETVYVNEFLRDFINYRYLKHDGDRCSEAFEKWLRLNDDTILFIIDGLDELTTPINEKGFLFSLVKGRALPNSCVILTTRASQTPKLSQIFPLMDIVYAIRGFCERSIHNFIDAHFQDDQRKESLKRLMSSHSYNFLQQLAQVPLQLEIICKIWEVNGNFDEHCLTRTTLFESYWQMKLNDLDPKIVPANKLKEVEQILGGIAWHGIASSPPKFVFTYKHKRQLFQDECIELEKANALIPAGVFEHFKSKHILYDAVANEVSPDSKMVLRVKFHHKTYQEFLAAKYVATSDHSRLISLLKVCFTPGCISNHRFDCIAVFIAGLMDNNLNLRGVSMLFEQFKTVFLRITKKVWCEDEQSQSLEGDEEKVSKCCIDRMLQMIFQCISEIQKRSPVELQKLLLPLNEALVFMNKHKRDSVSQSDNIKLSVNFYNRDIPATLIRGITKCFKAWNSSELNKVHFPARIYQLQLENFHLKSDLYLTEFGKVIQSDKFLESFSMTLQGMPNSSHCHPFSEYVASNTSITTLSLDAVVDQMGPASIEAIPKLVHNNSSIRTLNLFLTFSEECGVACSLRCPQCVIPSSINKFLKEMSNAIKSCRSLENIVLTESFFRGNAVDIIIPALIRHPGVKCMSVTGSTARSCDLGQQGAAKLVVIFRVNKNLERFHLNVTKLYHLDNSGRDTQSSPTVSLSEDVMKQLASAIIENMSIKDLRLAISWVNTMEMEELARIVQNDKALEQIDYDIHEVTPDFLEKLAFGIGGNSTLIKLKLSGKFGFQSNSVNNCEESQQLFWKAALENHKLFQVELEGKPFSDSFAECMCDKLKFTFDQFKHLGDNTQVHLMVSLSGRVEGPASMLVKEKLTGLLDDCRDTTFQVEFTTLSFSPKPYYFQLIPVNLAEIWQSSGFESELKQMISQRNAESISSYERPNYNRTNSINMYP